MSRHKPKDEICQTEEIIQAVVIADSFNSRFVPLTRNKPRALIPLVNTPLIDYTLEWLATSGVGEVFLFASVHANQIKEHIRNSKWIVEGSNHLTIHTIVSEDCRSLGDALRDIDAKAVIRGDFILVTGDVISNIPLKPLVQEHKKRGKVDKGLVMTLVFQQSTPRHASYETESLAVVERVSKRILHHQRLRGNKRAHFPLELFLDNSEVEICFDIMDASIAICSMNVPPLFSENFDYQTKDDFVRGILIINEEILVGNTIYMHYEKEKYAARVANLHMYHSVSQDIMQRWVYPFVPDFSIANGGLSHSYHRYHVSKQKSVTLSRGSVLVQNVVVGENTTIGSNTTISHSVVGRNCIIGNNVKLQNSYLWDNCVIKDNCIVDWSILGEGVHLSQGVQLKKNCVLESGVQLPDGYIENRSNTRFTVVPMGKDRKSIGPKAYIYSESHSDDSDSDESSCIEWMYEESDSQSNESSSDHESLEEEERDESPMLDDARIFYGEVLDSLSRGFEEKVGQENLVLEINSSKYAYNVTMTEVNSLVMKAVLTIPWKSHGEKSAAELLAQTQKVLPYFQPLFKNYIKSPESEMEYVAAIDEFACQNIAFGPIVPKVLHFLYEKDVVSETIIMQWYANPCEDPDNGPKIKKYAQPFVTWLEEAEEESDESDSL